MSKRQRERGSTTTMACKRERGSDDDSAVLKDSAALGMHISLALVERDPLPHEMAVDEESRCKYLSKQCWYTRAVKAKGELHRLCTFHRAKAIMNQRRLEERKRGGRDVATSIAKQAKPATKATKNYKNKKSSSSSSPCSPSSNVVMLSAIDVAPASDPPCEPPTKRRSFSGGKLSPRDMFEFEPFLTPATLYPEDLEEIWGLVDVDGFM